jgi:hypothetical protein
MGQKLIDLNVDILHKGWDHHPQMRHYQGRSRKVCLEATDLCTGTRELLIEKRTIEPPVLIGQACIDGSDVFPETGLRGHLGRRER